MTRTGISKQGNYILDTFSGEWILCQKPSYTMNRINPFAFYQFGQTIQPLLNLPTGGLVGAWTSGLLSAASWIENTCNNPLLPVRACRNAGNTAIAAMRQLASKAADSQITAQDAAAVVVSLFDFQAVFREELNISDTYIVAQKAHFSTTILVENGELMFPDGIRILLPDEAIYDIRQGARCFAFELPTAAGFHFLRAIEGVIRKFYDVLSNGAKRPARAAMGIYIDELIKLNADPELVATLKQIKDLHRNPVNHPEETLDMTEAQMLMGIMQSAIFAMTQIVNEKQKLSPAIPVPAVISPAP